jgi:hypothetical protein
MDKHFGKLFGTIFSGLEHDVLAKAKSGDIHEEDHITSALFERAEERINLFAEEMSTNDQLNRLTILARHFQGRGAKSDEFFSGADGAVVLRIRLASLEIQKIYLFQAKKSTQKKFNAHAITQRDRMLRCTPDCFFLIYSPENINFVSAFLVEEGDKYIDLPHKGLTEFNQDFFNCFIGDHFNGYPDLPYSRPWRYWPYDYPPAKDNLFIEVVERTS